jgi:stearoyl-CoA desaturase (delta-9 desaturase)
MFYRTGMCSSYKYPDHIDPIKQSPDLMKDPVYRFLEQYGTNSWAAHYLLNIGICIGFRVLLLWCFGWAVALASCIAAVLAFNAPLVFNILSHIPRLGYRNFATEDDSNNCWWLAILSMGDGWHNNHHAIPGSARTGLRPHEIDMSWLILKTCRSLKLVSHLNEPRKHPNGTAYTSNFSKTREIYPLELALDQQRS